MDQYDEVRPALLRFVTRMSLADHLSVRRRSLETTLSVLVLSKQLSRPTHATLTPQLFLCCPLDQGSDSDDSDADDRVVDDAPADVRGSEAFDGIPTGGTAAGVDDSVADMEVDDGASLTRCCGVLAAPSAGLPGDLS